ncbi:MAG: hypothetical protein A2015_05550 [Spirochaetes bacterium GWF1_31_7]|nr:MAG: hypothetical protein A2Y30_04660 [Spirochaetes bacterium GWE1_32_154]OHD52556.1 MAG: hypothetical protein A2015_05550 [Spirochaetes bacterium GWF1_31_7]OHD80640.1 MAG: hypothetical protein A2355_02485 [Spirochaetes bacterium RIFOXYB1_FULL_32_8]HBD93432.1 adenylate/guanylate cyclase domain-containing protein [Spirochaetia bacterium]HBI36260.1 adenylate/guanylate cyclase domain-containing protein [Spirochaetia bacterium]
MGLLEERAAHFGEQETAEIVIELVNTGRDEDLFHIDVYGIADKWSIERKVMLDIFIKGVKHGIFTMQWEFHCPSCGGVAREILKLDESSREDHCPICVIDFNNQLDQNIEVFFSVSPDIRVIPIHFKKEYNNEIIHDITHNKRYEWRKSTTIYGADCLNNAIFRSLFGDDTLPLDQSLEMSFVTLLFTDIRESTALYERLGDVAAFKLVKEHFDIIFKEILKNNGVPVKTIGDAVMGVFSNELECLKAAIETQLRLKEFYNEKDDGEIIEVKIGLHSGPVIVVTLNGKIDYFGSTVNLAARVQGKALPNEVVFTEKIFNNVQNQKLLKGYTDTLHRSLATLKGIENEVELYKIKL